MHVHVCMCMCTVHGAYQCTVLHVHGACGPAPRRAAHLLLGQPLLVLLVLVLTQHPAVERTAALGAPHLAAALGAADGIPFVRRDQQTARVRRSHLTAPLGPEEVGPMRLLLRLD